MAKKETKAHKVQSSVEEYTNFVLTGLIGIKGTSKSHVISFIIKSWITANSELLENYGLSVKDWKKGRERHV